MDDNVREHKITIENRETLTVTAVDDIESFDEEKIVIQTEMGQMTVIGDNFRINRLNVDDGHLIIEGEIDEIKYSQLSHRDEGGGFLSRLFK